MNYYPFHIGDYASATRHLTWTEDAAYRRLLDVYYVREQPLPLDHRQVYRLVIASSEEQRLAVDTVLDEFFVRTDDSYRHVRCDAEIERAAEKRTKASQSAKARWGNATKPADAMPTKSERNAIASDRDANASTLPCEGNAPNPNPNPNPNPKENPNPPIPPTAAGGGGCAGDETQFGKFWAAYPKKVGKEAARKAWLKIRREADALDLILTALAWQTASDQWTRNGGQYIPNPVTYLNQQRWLDEKPQAVPIALSSVGRKGAAAASRWLESQGIPLEKSA